MVFVNSHSGLSLGNQEQESPVCRGFTFSSWRFHTQIRGNRESVDSQVAISPHSRLGQPPCFKRHLLL